MGDFNAKVGDERIEDIVGPSGIGTVNERGSRLIEWCEVNDFTITKDPEIEVGTQKIIFSFRRQNIEITAGSRRTNMAEAEGGWGWMVVFSCFLFHVLSPGAMLSLSVFYPSWVEDFNASRGLTSWVIGMAVSVAFGSGPFSSSLVSRFGHRRVVIAGSIVCSAAFFASCFAPSVYVLIALVSVPGGLGMGMQSFPHISMIPLYFKKRRSFAMGIAVSGVGFGSFVYPPFLAWLEEQYNWRGAMIIISGLILNVILCGAILRPYKPQDQSSAVEIKAQKRNTSESVDTSSLSESSSESKDSAIDSDSDSISTSCLRDALSLWESPCLGVGFGSFVYPPFLAWLEEQYNWRGAMLIISGLILNVILCGALLRPYKPQDQSSAVEIKAQKRNTSESVDTSSLSESSSESKDSAIDSDSTSTSCLSSEDRDKETRPDESALEKNNLLLKSNQQLIEQNKEKIGETPILDIRKTENWSIMSAEMCTKSEKSENVSDLFILPSRNSKAVTSDISHTSLHFSPGKLYLWQKRTALTNQTQGEMSVNLRFLKDKYSEHILEKQELSNSFMLKDKRGIQAPSKNSEVRPNTQPTVIPPESVTSPISSQPAQESQISKRRRFKLFANTLSILGNPCFTVYTVSSLLASMTFLMPPVYIVDRAIELGVEKRQAALALSMVGAGNMLGRLLVGFIADHFFDNFVWNVICLVLSGVATCLSPLCGSNAVLHGVYGFAFGLFIGLSKF
ncbi:monocarboxylate transporter 12-like [Plakobranchus ocellatus]|uniref:Monocarboxylate transporter 12-like n=1 Tax=Plakobranchus ocellatus TaxID=259542 RepID=A0AAV4DRF7_9GAST|nr:monocarboxylate transporter 12-like [Plakobranchus ocellatus]